MLVGVFERFIYLAVILTEIQVLSVPQDCRCCQFEEVGKIQIREERLLYLLSVAE